jgi:hypothetical protein
MKLNLFVISLIAFAGYGWSRPIFSSNINKIVVEDTTKKIRQEIEIYSCVMKDVSGLTGVYLEIAEYSSESGQLLSMSSEKHHIPYYGCTTNHLVEANRKFFRNGKVYLRVVEKKMTNDFGYIKLKKTEFTPSGQKVKSDLGKSPKVPNVAYKTPNFWQRMVYRKNNSH